MSEKQTVIDALRNWIHQRPGLDFGNYGDVKSYRADLRLIGKQLDDARALLRYVELFNVELDAESFQRAFSGRLKWDGKKLHYCTGQYWCTEYRAAACAVLATAIRREWTDWTPGSAQKIRDKARREFGRGIASRWFN